MYPKYKAEVTSKAPDYHEPGQAITTTPYTTTTATYTPEVKPPTTALGYAAPTTTPEPEHVTYTTSTQYPEHKVRVKFFKYTYTMLCNQQYQGLFTAQG